MERMQSTWENLVDYDMSESGIRAVSLNELRRMGFDLDAVLDMPLGYSQSNGTVELRELISSSYPGSANDNIEVTNGTSEANYLLLLSMLSKGDEVALEIPNYMQIRGIAKSLGARVNTFSLNFENEWEPDWESFDNAVTDKTKLVYLSNPNNPTGKVLSHKAMQRIIERCEQTGAYLIADEVYIGAELEGMRTKSFWGMSDRIIVTSGLSKAYGIPGIRIGWIVGPKDIIYQCWTQHDYITIGPNKLSDIITRTAVRTENREKLYSRTHKILDENYPVMREWIAGFGDTFRYRKPDAGAFCFLHYRSGVPSVDFVKTVLKNQNTLIVPGSHFGTEGFLRIWMGAQQDYLNEGLRRIGIEVEKML